MSQQDYPQEFDPRDHANPPKDPAGAEVPFDPKLPAHETHTGLQLYDNSPPHPLQLLSKALDAGHDVEKLKQLMDLAERYDANEAKKAFAKAFAAFQRDCPPITKGKTATVTMRSGGAYSYQYADLDHIMRIVRPVLGKHGLSVRYNAEIGDEGRRIRSTCFVQHEAGHIEETTFVVPVDLEMKVNPLQQIGSANSYACRYNVVNALGLTTGEDDDGAMGERTRGAPQADPGQFFPFGKYKGQPWDSVPTDYLEWVVGHHNDQDIRDRAIAQINARQGGNDDNRA